MPNDKPDFINQNINLHRTKPWWYSNLTKKSAPSAERPLLAFWARVPPMGHAIYSHPQMCVIMQTSLHGQFSPIPGMPQPALAAKYYTPGNFQWDADGNFEILFPGMSRDEKENAHAEFMAQQIANMQFASNMFRGFGSHHDGTYGGGATVGEIGTTSFLNAEAYRRLFCFMHDMRDATPRTVTVKTSAGGATRTITLPKRKVTGEAPIAGDTAEVLAAIEALTDGAAPGVRQGGVFSLRSDYGRAEVTRFMRLLGSKLKAKLDNYVSPLDGRVYQLCYPKFWALSLETFGFDLAGPLNRFVAADVTPPLTHSAFYEQIGGFWNERGDPDAPNARFTDTMIFRRRSDGKAMSMRDAILDDPVLSAPVGGEFNLLTSYAPALASAASMSQRMKEAVMRMERHAMNWAVYDSMVLPLREFFPETEFTNFDDVCVKDPLVAYERVGKRIRNAQTQTWLGLQGPTLYPRAAVGSWPLAAAIRDAGTVRATENAIAAFDDADLDAMLSICGTLDFSKTKAMPFIMGLEPVEELRKSVAPKTEWGGSPELLGRLLVDQKRRHGFTGYSIYGGNLDLTCRILSEVSKELAA